MLILMWLKQGISSRGFVSMYRFKETILWEEISKVNIVISKELKITLFGSFMEQTFYFKNSSYDKIITIFRENLPKEANIQVDKK